MTPVTSALSQIRPQSGASRPVPFQGTLVRPDVFEPRFASHTRTSPKASRSGPLHRLFLGFLAMVDQTLGRDTDHIRRVVEHVGTPERLQLERTGLNSFTLSDTETGKVLASIKHPKNSDNQLELYLGKGGFTAVVTSKDGTRYFGLGDSKITVGDTDVQLHGEAITSNPAKKTGAANQHYTQQSATTQAMILGAGLATRFEPVSGERTLRSKPDVYLNGEQTVIANIANVLSRSGFTDLFVNTFFMPEPLEKNLASLDYAKVNFISEQAPSGTAGGLRKLLQNPDAFGFDVSKPIMIVQGDAVTDVDLGKLMDAHERNNALVTIGCQSVDKDDVDKFGIVVTDESDPDGVSGTIKSFQEKPKPEEALSQLGNTGFYIFSPEAFPLLLEVYNELPAEQRDKELDFAKHVFPKILEKAGAASGNKRPFWAQKVDGYWSDIGNPTQYLEAVYDLFEGKVNLPLPKDATQYLDNGVFYWPGAKAAAKKDGAALAGNVVVALPYRR